MSESRSSPARLVVGLLTLLAGVAGLSWFLQGVLSSPTTAAPWLSRKGWGDLTKWLAGDNAALVRGAETSVPFGVVFLLCAGLVLVVWLVGSLLAVWRSGRPFVAVGSKAGIAGGVFLLSLGVFELVRPFLPPVAGQWIEATSHLWFSAAFAGFLATPLWLSGPRMGSTTAIGSNRFAWLVLLAACAAFVGTFTWMNWGLYDSLLLPHGDSAMYEEHIWNLTHGKGFRSFLDQGLFLGEHIQVAHLLLTPVHLLWPSQLMMELCESLSLGLSAIAVFLIARRHTRAPMASAALGVAWLLYFPMHYLDISIDIKTFRPICLGVPALLFGIDQWERKRFWSAGLLFLVTLSAKEDFALVLAPLGLYFALAASARRERVHGLAWCIGVTVYLVLTVIVIIPEFRSGNIVHYSRYFGELGSSPTEIVKTAFRDPLLVSAKLFRGRSLLYTVLLLLPCAFLPLLSSRRLLVVVPVFCMLCLLELDPVTVQINGVDTQQDQMLVPFHHFHATMLPIMWWATAAGLGRFADGKREQVRRAVGLACCTGLVTGLFYSMSPLGISFYDSGSRLFWEAMYLPSERAEQVEKVLAAIPQTARVASTDFVHTRMTHYERSYDYSGYRTSVPDDVDYIVIDAKHPWPGYSMATRMDEVKEVKSEPGVWEDVGIDTDGYFIVLRRRRSQTD